jgi:hypothetical protein
MPDFGYELLATLGTAFFEILIGIIAAVLFWLALRWFAPRVSFDTKIRNTLREGHEVHQIRFGNSGKRVITDVQITVRLHLRQGGIARIADLTTDTKHIPYILPQKTGEYHDRKIVSMHPELTNDFELPIYEKKIRDARKDQTLTLPQIMEYGGGSNCYLEIIITGTDAWSWTRRIFVSKEYKLTDIASSFDELKAAQHHY